MPTILFRKELVAGDSLRQSAYQSIQTRVQTNLLSVFKRNLPAVLAEYLKAEIWSNGTEPELIDLAKTVSVDIVKASLGEPFSKEKKKTLEDDEDGTDTDDFDTDTDDEEPIDSSTDSESENSVNEAESTPEITLPAALVELQNKINRKIGSCKSSYSKKLAFVNSIQEFYNDSANANQVFSKSAPAFFKVFVNQDGKGWKTKASLQNLPGFMKLCYANGQQSSDGLCRQLYGIRPTTEACFQNIDTTSLSVALVSFLEKADLETKKKIAELVPENLKAILVNQNGLPKMNAQLWRSHPALVWSIVFPAIDSKISSINSGDSTRSECPLVFLHSCKSDGDSMHLFVADQKRRNAARPNSSAVLKHGQDVRFFRDGVIGSLVEANNWSSLSICDPAVGGGEIKNLFGPSSSSHELKSFDKSSTVAGKAGIKSLGIGKVH